MSMKKIAAFIVVAGLLVGGTAMAGSWHHGKVIIVESFSSKIYVDWDRASSASPEGCTRGYSVELTESSVGNAEALKRAFSLILAASVSGKSIRFHLEGCSATGRPLATVVQLCTNSDCSYPTN